MVVVVNEPSSETPRMSDLRINQRLSTADHMRTSENMDFFQVTSVNEALDLLLRGINSNSRILANCVEYLDRNIERNNLLLIYNNISKCLILCNEFTPSAPPIASNQFQRQSGSVKTLLEDLRFNCLLEIDKHADYILQQNEIADLSYCDILSITERDTLQVSDEVLVYCTVYRWGIAECKRRNMETHNSLKTVSKDLRFTPRYGLMSKEKFMSKKLAEVNGPTRGGLLEEKEWRMIKFFIDETSKKRPVELLKYKWSQSRIVGHKCSKYLSLRSINASSTNNSENVTPSTRCKIMSTREKCLIDFLSCWTAVFD